LSRRSSGQFRLDSGPVAPEKRAAGLGEDLSVARRAAATAREVRVRPLAFDPDGRIPDQRATVLILPKTRSQDRIYRTSRSVFLPAAPAKSFDRPADRRAPRSAADR
jgi:hypothetical protein